MICQLEDCVDCLRVIFPGAGDEKLFSFHFVYGSLLVNVNFLFFVVYLEIHNIFSKLFLF